MQTGRTRPNTDIGRAGALKSVCPSATLGFCFAGLTPMGLASEISVAVRDEAKLAFELRAELSEGMPTLG